MTCRHHAFPDPILSRRQVLKIAAATGKYEGEAWRVRKDGTKFWANVLIDALRNDVNRRRRRDDV